MLSSRIHLGSSTRIRKQSIRQSDVERIFNQPPQGAAFQRDLILYEKPNQSQTANGRESTRIQSLRKKETIPPFLSRSGSVRAALLDVLQLFSSIALAWDKRNRPTTVILTLADDTLNVFDNSASVGAWRGQRFPPIESYFAMRNV